MMISNGSKQVYQDVCIILCKVSIHCFKIRDFYLKDFLTQLLNE